MPKSIFPKITSKKNTVVSYYSLFVKKNSGFTLVELLVVFGIIGILGSVSLASFVDYSRSQELKTASSELTTLLSQAKSRAQSQVKPSTCGTNQLRGYEVRICGLTGSTCTGEGRYAMYVHCGALPSQVSTKSLPSNLSFDEEATTSRSFLFNVLHQGVTGAGNVVLTGYEKSLTVSVSPAGTIEAQ